MLLQRGMYCYVAMICHEMSWVRTFDNYFTSILKIVKILVRILAYDIFPHALEDRVLNTDVAT